MRNGINRRTALKSLGAIAAGGLLHGSCADDQPLSETIDTIVLLMLENRSFDHYFGALRLEEGRMDVDGLDAAMMNPRASGEAVPVYPADASCIADPPHGWSRSHAQWNEGKNDGFVREYADAIRTEDGAQRVMGYLNRAALPAAYALADEFAICNRWFASLMTGTWPNRFYSLGAQSAGQRSNEKSAVYDFLTIYDLARSSGHSYGIYFGNLSFSTLLARDYPRDQFYGHDRFFDDAAAGSLPNLTVVEPIYGWNDDHPPLHPLAGQIFIATIYDAIARSPQWNRTLMIVSYDEHGGFFDHVAPPKAPDERAADGFDQCGFRVPAMVVGPYVKRRYAGNTVYDHTSTIAFLRNLWGTRSLTERDAAANDITDLLDRSLIDAKTPRTPVTLPVIEADDSVIHAPECMRELGFLVGSSSGSSTGQPELERWLEARPELAWADRRRDAERMFQSLLVRAERRGLVRVR